MTRNVKHFRAFSGYRTPLKAIAALICVIGLYSLAGFFWIPALLKSRIPAVLADQLGVEVEIEALHFNPFAFTLEVDKLLIRDKHRQPLLGIGALNINVETGATLQHRELHIGEILVSHPVVTLHRLQDGRFNFTLPRSEGDGGKLPFSIDKLSVENAEFAFDDRSVQPAFQTHWLVQHAELRDLSSQAGNRTEFSLSATGKTAHEQLTIKGQLGLAPLKIESELTLQNLDIAEAGRYLSTDGQYQIKSAVMSGHIRHTHQHDSQTINVVNATLHDLFIERPLSSAYLKSKEVSVNDLIFNINDASIDSLRTLHIKNLAFGMRGAQDSTPTELDLPLTEAAGIKLNARELSLKIDRLVSSGAHVPVWRNQNGQLTMIPGALWDAQAVAPGATPPLAKNDWKIGIDSLELEQFQASLRDLTVTPAANFVLPPLNLRLGSFSTQAGEPMRITLATDASSAGKAGIEGKFSINPLLIADFHLSMQGIPLAPLQPYLDKYAQINLISGLLAVEGNIDYYQGTPSDSLRFSGEAGITQLLTRDKRYGKDFIGCKALNMREIVFETLPNKRLGIGDISSIEPYARIVISRDGKVNLRNNLTPSATRLKRPFSSDVAVSEKPLPVTIGRLKIREGQADFSDFTLLPTSFSTNIQGLNGTIRSLSAEENTRSDVLLEGRLNTDEPVKIFGQINPLSLKTYSSLEFQFRDINLAPFSPYSAKLAGYRIEEGKLSMDLKYLLTDNQLEVSNRFRIDRLTLGERVDSPGATKLPLKLAIALLKDSNGRIEFELPVSGDLTKPDTDIGGILADAAVKMFTKLVSAPFSVIGGIFFSKDQNDKQAACLPFASGQSTLNNSETEKLLSVAKILENRPTLHLDIRGAVNPEFDRKGMAENALMAQLKNLQAMELRLVGRKEAASVVGDLSSEEYKRLFIRFYQAKYPDDPTAVLLRNSADNPDSFELARKKVLKDSNIREADFRRLAENRAQRIRNILLSQSGLSGDRIYLQDVTITQGSDTPPGACLSLDGN